MHLVTLISALYTVGGILMCATLTAATVDGALPESQLDALHALYAANDGDNWIWSPPPAGVPWNFSATDGSPPNPCALDWQGVTCVENCTTSTAACSVTELSLPEHGLTGSLPAEISKLADLAFLNVYRNTMTGTLPTSLGLLTELTNIIVYRNCMTGTVSIV